MTIYVSSELWRSVCMETRDSSSKLPTYSIFFLKKLVGLILNTFEVFVWKIVQQWRILLWQISFCDIGIVDGSLIGEFARRSLGKHSNTVRLLHCHSHICYVSKTNALLKAHRCPSCDKFISGAPKLGKKLTACTRGLKHFFQRMGINCEKHYLTK